MTTKTKSGDTKQRERERQMKAFHDYPIPMLDYTSTDPGDLNVKIVSLAVIVVGIVWICLVWIGAIK